MSTKHSVTPDPDDVHQQIFVTTLTEDVALNHVVPSPPQASLIQQDVTRSKLADFFTLTKPEITFLVTISAVAGYLLGSTSPIDGFQLVALMIGVALSSAGGAAFNHYIERHKDAEMKRTENRPLPAGRIKPVNALALACISSLAGLTLLLVFTNPLTSLLAALTIVLYIFLYTPLKQHTKYNTFVGTIPGALPALGGWTAATGSVAAGGWVIFAILVIWQLPHFLALAWMYRKDYGRAGFKMLPVVEPLGRSTANQMLVSAVFLLIASILPTFMGLTGVIYFAGVLLVSLWLLGTCVVFYRTMTNVAARRVLKASIVHIPVLVLLLIIDRFI
ncbi:MAG: heme o synthase [Bacteroidota bacterium]